MIQLINQASEIRNERGESCSLYGSGEADEDLNSDQQQAATRALQLIGNKAVVRIYAIPDNPSKIGIAVIAGDLAEVQELIAGDSINNTVESVVASNRIEVAHEQKSGVPSEVLSQLDAAGKGNDTVVYNYRIGKAAAPGHLEANRRYDLAKACEKGPKTSDSNMDGLSNVA